MSKKSIFPENLEAEVDETTLKTNENNLNFDELLEEIPKMDPSERLEANGLDGKLVEASDIDGKLLEAKGLDGKLTEANGLEGKLAEENDLIVRLSETNCLIKKLSESRSLKENLSTTSSFKRSKKKRLKSLKAYCAELSETDRLKRLEKRSSDIGSSRKGSNVKNLARKPEMCEKGYKTESHTINSEPKEKRCKRLNGSLSGQDSSGSTNAEEASEGNDTSKLLEPTGMKIVEPEERSAFSQVLDWMEQKIAKIKALPTSSEVSTDEKITAIENALKNIKNAECSANSEYKGMSLLIDNLEETAKSILDNTNKMDSFHSIKDLGTLTRHLTATAGMKVTIEDVQKYINSESLMNLYRGYLKQKEPFLKEMETLPKYVEQIYNEVKKAGEEYLVHFEDIEHIYTKNVASPDLQEVNQQLKSVAAKSEELLKEYEEVIGYLVKKTKDFQSAKNGTERLYNTLMTQEIQNLFKVSA